VTRVPLVVVLAAALSFPPVAVGSAHDGSTRPPDGIGPGDVLTNGTLSVAVPGAGRGVWGEAVLIDGAMEVIGVETRSDGSVEVISWDEPDTVSVGALPTSAAECSDRARSTLPFKWTRRLAWLFNAASTPAGLAKRAVETSLKRATTNITRAANACRMRDDVRALAVYRGRTAKATQIGADGSCAPVGDGRSVTGFGSLPADQLGLACIWFQGNRALETDVLLSNTHSWTTGTGGSCVERWSVEAVMTHERGHSFGLGHVDEVEHGNLTMSERINGPCQKSEARLGRGDVLALRSLY
jgi:Matrixin